MDCADIVRCQKETPGKFIACVDDDCQHCADCFKNPQTSEADVRLNDLLNAKDIAVAEKLAKSILYRLEGNKNPPMWLVGSLNTLRGVLWKANKRSESI